MQGKYLNLLLREDFNRKPTALLIRYESSQGDLERTDRRQKFVYIE